MRSSLTFLPLVLATAAVVSALPARADDDRFTLRLGAMQTKAESQLFGSTTFNGQDYDYTSERVELGNDITPRIEGAFRISNRNRVLFNYFQYDEDKRATLGQDVTFDETTIPAGSSAGYKTKFDLASVVYDFAVVETPTISVGLQVGAEWARLKASASATDGTNSFVARGSESGTAPVVGARFSANTEDQKWRFVVQAQYLDAEWGNFDDYTGDLSRANALVEYRFTKNVGVFAGYDWFKLNVRQTGQDGIVGLDQRFKGPMAGVTFAF